MHEETIASVEQGRRPLKPDLAKALDRVLDTKRALETAVDNMPEIDLIPAWAEQYMDIEREAIALSCFDEPGAAGSAPDGEYARAVFRQGPGFSEDEINAQVAARLERQEILHRKVPPTLLRPLGGDRAGPPRRRRSVQGDSCAISAPAPISRASRSRSCPRPQTHAGLAGPFILLETPDHQHLAYTETSAAANSISDPDEVSILAQKYAMLRTQALNPRKRRACWTGC